MNLQHARALLVGAAVVTAIVAAVIGQWVVTGVLAVGVAAHTVHIVVHRRREAAGAGSQPPTGS